MSDKTDEIIREVDTALVGDNISQERLQRLILVCVRNLAVELQEQNRRLDRIIAQREAWLAPVRHVVLTVITAIAVTLATTAVVRALTG